uniref:Uncharacterized protein n=1 Tax=Talaromyces marneffei PM1 TaxID=1077442 RepID=A0A093VAR5_TALMA
MYIPEVEDASVHTCLTAKGEPLIISLGFSFGFLTPKIKFITSALILILPLTALAAPSPAPASAIDPAAAIPISDAAKSRIAALSDDEIFTKRNTEVCEIINVSSYVYCCSGPGTGYSAEYELYGGYTWGFTCYEEGTCVDGNWFVKTFPSENPHEVILRI